MNVGCGIGSARLATTNRPESREETERNRADTARFQIGGDIAAERLIWCNYPTVNRRLMGMSRLVVSLLLSGCLLAACGGTDPGDAAIPFVDLFEQPVADAPDPAERAGAAADYIECTYGISNGGWSRDFGPSGTASNPDGTLERFLDAGWFGLPGEGYAAQGRDTDRLPYTYSVDESPKVAIIVADTSASGLDSADGWTVETYATCDPAEYGPSIDDQLSVDVWLDAEDNRVLTSIVTSFQGGDHCGWESVTFLVLGDRQYIGDPRGVLADVVWFDDHATLPADATDTGYRNEGRHLWMSADGEVAYLIDSNRVEAWPAPTSAHPVACA